MSIKNTNAKKQIEVILIDEDADGQEIFSEALKDALPELIFALSIMKESFIQILKRKQSLTSSF